MAWYWDINPSNHNGNQYITIPAVNITGDFTIELDCELYNTLGGDGFDGFAFSGGTTGGGFELYRDSSFQNYAPSLWYNNTKNAVSTSNIWPYVSGSTVNPRRITIQRTGNSVTSNFAGTAGTAITINSGNNILISAIGARPNGTFSLGMRLYKLKITWSGGTRTYNPSLGNGTGTTIPTEEGGNSGTFINPPANNAQWVFYSSGATYQLTALGGTFSYSGAQASLLRQFKLQTLGATYAYSGASANLTYVPTGTVYTLTALGGSFAYSGGQASLLRRFRLVANGGAYAYSGGSANLTYNQLPGVYRLTALGATYTYTGGIAAMTATGVTPMANAGAYVIQAYVGGTQTISAKIGGRQTIQAMVAI